VECESKRDTGNNRGDWDHCKTLRLYLSSISGQHEIKEIIKKKNSHFGNCTHTVESADAKVQNIFHGRNNITSSTNCKYRTAATLYTLKAWVISGV